MINLWRRSTPDGFLFSAKVPKRITHDAKLHDAGELMSYLCKTTSGLGDKLGPLVVLLPPSFNYDREVISMGVAIAEWEGDILSPQRISKRCGARFFRHLTVVLSSKDFTSDVPPTPLQIYSLYEHQ